MARTILSLPSALLSVIWLLPLVADSLLRLLGHTGHLHPVVGLWPWVVSVVWAWSLFTYLTQQVTESRRFAVTQLIYLVVIILLAFVALAPKHWTNNPSLLLGACVCLLAFFAMGLSAYQLDRLEHPTRLSFFWRMNGLVWWTMAIFALPIGIWFLKPRVSRIAL